MILQTLKNEGVIDVPKWVIPNTAFLCIVGSEAYGASLSGSSDKDVYGFCIPEKAQIFPHMAGEIAGFGTPAPRFQQWQQHHVKSKDGNEYDFTVYSIVKYFDLAMKNNPNIIDILFTPRHCVLHATPIGNMVRDRRKVFLSKATYHSCRGYAFSQLAKLEPKTKVNPKRQAAVDAVGFDTKYAMHLVRLMLQCEMILETGDLDLTANAETLRAVRAGEWALPQVHAWFENMDRRLDMLRETSPLPEVTDENVVRTLLLDCLEEFYGDLKEAVTRDIPAERILDEMQALLNRYR